MHNPLPILPPSPIETDAWELSNRLHEHHKQVLAFIKSVGVMTKPVIHLERLVFQKDLPVVKLHSTTSQRPERLPNTQLKVTLFFLIGMVMEGMSILAFIFIPFQRQGL